MRTPAGKGGGKGERTQSKDSPRSRSASPRPIGYDLLHNFDALNVDNIVTNPPYRAVG